jgi:hypothetical protein
MTESRRAQKAAAGRSRTPDPSQGSNHWKFPTAVLSNDWNFWRIAAGRGESSAIMKLRTASLVTFAAALNAFAVGPFYVAPDGRDSNDGSKSQPFATLERARDQIRTIREGRGYPPDGIMVIVRGGRYAVTNTLTLDAKDACASNSPIIFRAADGETPIFSGAVRLKDFSPVTNAELLARLPDEARGKVVQCDVRACGVTKFEPLVLGGAYSGRGGGTHPLHELYFDGKPLPMARWPNDGFEKVANVSTNARFDHKGRTGSHDGAFGYSGDRPARWAAEKDLWLYGYWFWDWADSYEKVASIDAAQHEIQLKPPLHNYGFRPGQPFYAVNAFCEIDRPGEWVLDRDAGLLFLFPPSNPNRADVELSVFTKPFLALFDVSNVRFEGITWELGAGDGIVSKNCNGVAIAGCTIRNFGGEGVQIDGTNCAVRSCDVFNMGRGGIHLTGGSRKTLAPGGNVIENCDVHDMSRINHTYTPAVGVDGVGNRIAHNLLHDVGSSAIHVSGNDQVIEFNEVTRSVLESDDQGGAELFGDPTFRGNIFRWNFFHHNGSRWAGKEDVKLGQAGIRFDDAISGQRVVENIFWHTANGKHGFGAVQIHGGKDNIIESNLIANCDNAISFSQWHSATRWAEWVAKYTNHVDMTLYTSRYPELAKLYEGRDTNFVRGNLIANCGEFLHRGKAATERNVIVTNSLPPSKLLRLPGAPKIPVAQIGLQRDEFRRKLPENEIEKLRDGW